MTCIKDRPQASSEKFFYSLLNQTARPEIIVVDYGSRAENLEWERALFGDCLVEVKRDTKPFRQGRALNAGIRLARTPYIFTTDVDHIFPVGFVMELVHKIGPGKLVLARRVNLDQAGQVVDEAPPFFYGTCIGAEKSWFERVRGFDEFYTYHGDVDIDLVDRALSDGLEAVWLDARAYHQWHELSPLPVDNRNAVYRLVNRNRIVRNGKTWGQP